MLTYKSRGSRSRFYIIDKKKKLGFKTFETKHAAEYAYDIQCELAKHDLAPKVKSVIKRHKYKGKITGWGFDTEIATMLGCGGNDCECGECGDIEEDYNEKICNLCDDIEKIGLSFYDYHIGNVGIVYRNRKRVLVCIDTGRESVGREVDNSDDCSCSACQPYRSLS